VAPALNLPVDKLPLALTLIVVNTILISTFLQVTWAHFEPVPPGEAEACETKSAAAELA
jgi:hypothetical protein